MEGKTTFSRHLDCVGFRPGVIVLGSLRPGVTVRGFCPGVNVCDSPSKIQQRPFIPQWKNSFKHTWIPVVDPDYDKIQ